MRGGADVGDKRPLEEDPSVMRAMRPRPGGDDMAVPKAPARGAGQQLTGAEASRTPLGAEDAVDYLPMDQMDAEVRR
eukprot:9655498-Heterocapsa_arctica.AAC.1